jgi:hypothetical protein
VAAVRRRWLLAAVAAVAIAGATGWLARIPVPAAAGPLGSSGGGGENAPHTHVTADGMAGMPGMGGAAVPVGGTTASAGGYTLRPVDVALTAGQPGTLRLRVDGPDGQPATRFQLERDKLLHLILVRHDLTGYQHLHPTLAADGVWSVPVTLARPGSYRAYADFVALDAKGAATAAVLGIDLTVAGSTVPGSAADQPLPPPATSTEVAGYTVSYTGTPTVGTAEPFLFRITRSGLPVTPEHYLGAFGHLVMLRGGDLGYLHIHPEAGLADGAVKFWLAAPGPGSYRMYLDFQVDGQVHTAEFTVQVP